MKKAITLFLCIMLTTGMISGCAGREEETGSSEENTAAQEDKTDQDSQTEDQETEDDGSQEEQKEEPQDQQESGQGETDASQGEGQDRDMTEDTRLTRRRCTMSSAGFLRRSLTTASKRPLNGILSTETGGSISFQEITRIIIRICTETESISLKNN